MTKENDSAPAYEGGTIIEHDPHEPRFERSVWPLSTKVGLALAAVIGLGAVAAHSAGGFGPHRGGFAGHFADRALDVVDASTEQEEKIKAIVERIRDDIVPSRGDLRETRRQLMALIAAPTVDPTAIEKLRADRIAAIDEASKRAVSAIAEAAEVLTPEQRAKLASEIRDHMRNRW